MFYSGEDKKLEWHRGGQASSDVSHSHAERMRRESVAEMARVVEYYRDQQGMSSTKPNLLTSKSDISALSHDSIPDAGRCIQSLLQRKKQVFFVTNNAATNRYQLRETLISLLPLNDAALLTVDRQDGNLLVLVGTVSLKTRTAAIHSTKGNKLYVILVAKRFVSRVTGNWL